MVNAPECESDTDSCSTLSAVMEESDEEYDDDIVVRGKWMLDGCSSMDDIIERLQDHIRHYKALRDDGWELTHTIDDDYGHIKQMT